MDNTTEVVMRGEVQTWSPGVTTARVRVLASPRKAGSTGTLRSANTSLRRRYAKWLSAAGRNTTALTGKSAI
ncbi:MAG TPA: hypothetical protein PLD59_04605 [Tepidisphaeraceae bacterium]|nr:hypothetical protein [Tepidisphaeraceae bacterium]